MALWRRQAQKIWDGESSHEIDYVSQVKDIGGVALGRVCNQQGYFV